MKMYYNEADQFCQSINASLPMLRTKTDDQILTEVMRTFWNKSIVRVWVIFEGTQFT